MSVTNSALCAPAGEAPPWVTEFLTTLMLTGSVREAVEAAGIGFETAWALRAAEPEFAKYWDMAGRANQAMAAGAPFADAVAAAEAGVQ